MHHLDDKPYGSSWKSQRIVAIVMVFCLIAGSHALAASQGTLGENSVGSFTVRITKSARVRISNLADLALESWVSGDGDRRLTDDVCVFSSRGMGDYSITAIGNGPNATFSLSGGVNGLLPYRVYWNAGGVGSLNDSGIRLESKVTASGMTHAANDSSTCKGSNPGDTARLIVEFTAESLDAARDGKYFGILTLIVTPS